jgi:hypothetical protein
MSDDVQPRSHYLILDDETKDASALMATRIMIIIFLLSFLVPGIVFVAQELDVCKTNGEPSPLIR